MYKAKVKYNGNHYFCGETVRDSKIEKHEDGSIWLFDDEELNVFPYYDSGRNEWVQIDENSLEEEKKYDY